MLMKYAEHMRSMRLGQEQGEDIMAQCLDGFVFFTTEQHGYSQAQVEEYIANVHKQYDQLYQENQRLMKHNKRSVEDVGDEAAFGFSDELYFLKEHEQQWLNCCLKLNNFKVDSNKAKLLRQRSENGELNEDIMCSILSGAAGQKLMQIRKPVVEIRKEVYDRYFNRGQPKQEVEEAVENALKFYYTHGKS